MTDRLSLHSSSHKYSPTASEALSRGQNSKFSWRSTPPDPPTRLCMLYIRGLVLGLFERHTASDECAKAGELNEACARMDNCVQRAPHQSPLNMYVPLLLQSLDPPLQPLRRRLKFKDARLLISCLLQQLRTDHQRQAARPTVQNYECHYVPRSRRAPPCIL